MYHHAQFRGSRCIYEMIIDGRREFYDMRAAGRVYDNGWADVRVGNTVKYGFNHCLKRGVTKEERAWIADIADEWSESK